MPSVIKLLAPRRSRRQRLSSSRMFVRARARRSLVKVSRDRVAIATVRRDGARERVRGDGQSIVRSRKTSGSRRGSLLRDAYYSR